jgi:hypothetical protein
MQLIKSEHHQKVGCQIETSWMIVLDGLMFVITYGDIPGYGRGKQRFLYVSSMAYIKERVSETIVAYKKTTFGCMQYK